MNTPSFKHRSSSTVLLSLLCAVACGKPAESPGAEAAPAFTPPNSPVTPVTPATSAEAQPATRQSSLKAVNAGECTKNTLLDDAEDGDNRALVTDKRGGYWYTYADTIGTKIAPSGAFQMAEGGAEGSKHTARMSGKLGTGGIVYAGMGFLFTEPKAPYDVSCCKGVSFWAKKSGAGVGNVRVKLGDVNTTPDGGVCHDCYNDFGAELSFSETWKKYELPFADMKQEYGWGEPRPALDTSRLYQLQWQVRDMGADFDISVDKIELMGCGK